MSFIDRKEEKYKIYLGKIYIADIIRSVSDNFYYFYCNACCCYNSGPHGSFGDAMKELTKLMGENNISMTINNDGENTFTNRIIDPNEKMAINDFVSYDRRREYICDNS